MSSYKRLAIEQSEAGTVSVHVWDQDRIWKTAAGKIVRLEDLTHGHRRNLLAYLEQNAKRFHEKYCSWLSYQGPDEDSDVYWGYHAEVDQMFDMDPVMWMRSTDLYQALRRIETAYSGPPVDDINADYAERLGETA